MSKAISELNALCYALSDMRKPTASDSANQMYKRFCKQPGTGTMSITYRKSVGSKIYYVDFLYITWLGAISKLTIDTTKHC